MKLNATEPCTKNLQAIAFFWVSIVSISLNSAVSCSGSEPAQETVLEPAGMYEHYQQATHVAACSGGTSGLVSWIEQLGFESFHRNLCATSGYSSNCLKGCFGHGANLLRPMLRYIGEM